MKNKIKYCLCGLAVAALTACGDLYETHEKYLNMSEETYIGLADSLHVNGGLNRVELKWKLNADPRISTCHITWNGATEPLVVPADRSKEYMSQIIELPEGKYIFTVVVKSESGKESLIQTASGESYGSGYQERLPQRGINKFDILPNGATIRWAPEEGCIRTIVSYKNAAGEEKEVIANEDEAFTLVPDFAPESEFSIVSVFKPEKNAIDEVKSLSKKAEFPAMPEYYTIPKKEWESDFHKLYADVDHTVWEFEATTEETVKETPYPNGTVEALKDKKLDTFWHTQWFGDGGNPPLPQYITIDMLEGQTIQSIEVARRSGNADLKKVILSISDDKENWTKLGELSYSSDKSENSKVMVLPEPVEGRYIQVTVAESHNKTNASIAEIFFTSGEK